MDELTRSIAQEIELRREYIPNSSVSTIYFGGGTPSVLCRDGVERIMKQISSVFLIDSDAEITIEVNPDDVTEENAFMWRDIGFNRVSMGVQSWDDRVLKAINRRHTSKQVSLAIERLKKADFQNISVDLIYGLPYQDMDTWQMDVRRTTQYDIQHISSYGLSFEEGTLLYQWLKAGKIQEQEDDMYNEMYDFLCDHLLVHGFEHYEVSNFARQGYRSRHNSSYWNDTVYWGFGPGAHSYNGDSRQWNVDNLDKYIHDITYKVVPYEMEMLTQQQKWEEYVMLRMRVKEGMDLTKAGILFGKNQVDRCLDLASPYLLQGYLYRQDDQLRATRKGIKILNRIIEDLID